MVSTTAVIHVPADVNKDPNVEQKTQNFSHNFLEHIYTQVHSACAFHLQYLRICLFTLPLNEKLKVNVLGKSLICVSVSCNLNCTIFTTTVQVKRKYSYILNFPVHKTTALIMLFSFFYTNKGHLTSMTNDRVRLIFCCNVLLLDITAFRAQ